MAVFENCPVLQTQKKSKNDQNPKLTYFKSTQILGSTKLKFLVKAWGYMRTLFIFWGPKINRNYEISRKNWKFCENLTQKNFFEKIDFFWSSARKWAFCQKNVIFEKYPAKRSKKRVKKLESKGSTLWFFSKIGHFGK